MKIMSLKIEEHGSLENEFFKITYRPVFQIHFVAEDYEREVVWVPWGSLD